MRFVRVRIGLLFGRLEFVSSYNYERAFDDAHAMTMARMASLPSRLPPNMVMCRLPIWCPLLGHEIKPSSLRPRRSAGTQSGSEVKM